jgi:hypothetical protein
LFHVVRASSTMRPRSPNLLRSSARPDASVLHLRPPTRRSRCRRCFHRDPRSPRQPTCQCAARQPQADAQPSVEGRLIYHVPLPVSRKDQDRLVLAHGLHRSETLL